MSLFKNFSLGKLKEGLSKTREKIVNSITETVTGKAVIDDMTLDRIEEILLSSDIGFDTTEKIIEAVKRNLKSEKERSSEKIIEIVKEELTSVLVHSNSNHLIRV
jgi:fused signal recognition particle receptor